MCIWACSRVCTESPFYMISVDSHVQGTKSEWQMVFIIAAEVYLFGACIYLLLADGKKQWWADGVSKTRDRDLICSTRDASTTSS